MPEEEICQIGKCGASNLQDRNWERVKKERQDVDMLTMADTNWHYGG